MSSGNSYVVDETLDELEKLSSSVLTRYRVQMVKLTTAPQHVGPRAGSVVCLNIEQIEAIYP